jgi:hypothetical protein
MTVQYSATDSSWYSVKVETFNPCVEGSVTSSSSPPTGPGTLFGTLKGPLFPWKIWSDLGMKPQIRYSAYLSQQFIQCLSEIAYYGASIGGAFSALTGVAGTQIAISVSSVATGQNQRSAWTTIAPGTTYDFILFGIYMWIQSNTYTVSWSYPAIELRYSST